MIDWTKPVQTRDGKYSWGTDGSYLPNGTPSDLDLINVPEKRVVFVNMFPPNCCLSSVGESRSEADKLAAQASHRVACIRVGYEVGQFDDEVE